MKQIHYAILTVVLTISTFAQAKSEDGFIVKLRRGVGLNALTNDGIKIRDAMPEIGAVLVDRAPTNRDDFEYVAKNGRVRTQEVPGSGRFVKLDPSSRYSVMWDMKQIHAPEAWEITTGSRDVIAAVSDTGAWDHKQLRPNFWVNPGEIKKNKEDDDGNGFVDDINGWNFRSGMSNNRIGDDHYHGTHVSGTIGAHSKDGKGPMLGVNWQVSLMEVPFISGAGSGTDADGIKTIIYAANNGAKVINASWGSGDKNPALRDAIEYAKTKGVLFVAAAGNDSADNDGPNALYPAAYDCENIIAVAATNSSGTIAAFSNYGATSVDLAAPGDNIYSTWNPMQSPLRKFWYYEISGTSMAAPHVAGAVALIYAANPRLNWRQVKDLILRTVTPRNSLQGKTVTGGELNVGEAVRQAAAML